MTKSPNSVPARATTGINEAGVAQISPGREVEIAPLALPKRSLVPTKTKPVQILEEGLPEFRPATVPIEIFDP